MRSRATGSRSGSVSAGGGASGGAGEREIPSCRSPLRSPVTRRLRQARTRKSEKKCCVLGTGRLRCHAPASSAHCRGFWGKSSVLVSHELDREGACHAPASSANAWESRGVQPDLWDRVSRSRVDGLGGVWSETPLAKQHYC